MMNEINIRVLTDSIPDIDTHVGYVTIMKKAGIPLEKYELFKIEIVRYMKKKVRKFSYDNNGISIQEYTSLGIKDLFGYFGLYFTEEEVKNPDTKMKSIKISTLYNAWKNKEDYPQEKFVDFLKKYIANFVGFKNCFIYDDEIFIRPYISTVKTGY